MRHFKESCQAPLFSFSLFTLICLSGLLVSVSFAGSMLFVFWVPVELEFLSLKMLLVFIGVIARGNFNAMLSVLTVSFAQSRASLPLFSLVAGRGAVGISCTTDFLPHFFLCFCCLCPTFTCEINKS